MRNGSIVAVGLMLFFLGIALLFSFMYLPDHPVLFFRVSGVLGLFLIAAGLAITYIGIYRYVNPALPEWREGTDREIPKWVEVTENKESKPLRRRGIEPFVYQGYTLYKRMVKLLSGKWQVIYFFSKRLPKSGEPTSLPPGYKVGVNKRSGMPFLMKVR
ncbi:MAG TPA: hypothetical protein ENI45_00785 [Thermoplasmatales archaeon]|nr:hypothetical protein [Thermoplasmatales archaeon]